jgi:hypothetical protein
MFAVSAFMEEGKGGQSIYLDLDCELASSFKLVFVLHETSWEYDSNWCFGNMEG